MENPQNIELSQCLKSVSDFGKTTYENICTGATHVVSWGGADWFLAIILCAIGVIIALSLLAGIFMMMNDY